MPNRTLLFLAAWGLLLPILGCGSNVSLSGKVVYSDDKTPLTKGIVCFESDTYTARGKLNENGEYTIGSKSVKDGLLPGQYRVYISGAFHQEVPAGAHAEKEVNSFTQPLDASADGGAAMNIKPLIAAKYSRGATSGITVDVNASTRTFNFEVDRYQ